MLTYVGKGYTPAFSANFDRIAGRLAEGEDVLLVEGPDDICAPMAFECGAHCPGESVRQRDAEALAAVGQALGLVLQAGGRLCLTSAMVACMRHAFAGAAAGKPGLRRACGGCEWSPFCTDIAGAGYAGVKLKMRPGGSEPRRADDARLTDDVRARLAARTSAPVR